MTKLTRLPPRIKAHREPLPNDIHQAANIKCKKPMFANVQGIVIVNWWWLTEGT
jgi:hypothetical protein